MCSEQTRNLKLPLPNPHGRLSEDVHRLRSALIALDEMIGGLSDVVDAQIAEHSAAADARVQAMLVNATEQLNAKLAEAQAAVDALIAGFEEEAIAKLAGVTNNICIPEPAAGQPGPGENAFCLAAGIADGDSVDVEGLGRFIWNAQATDPVDHETCLLKVGQSADSPGRGLLFEPAWEAIVSEVLWLDDLTRLRRRKDLEQTSARFLRQAARIKDLESRLFVVPYSYVGRQIQWTQWTDIGSFDLSDSPHAICLAVIPGQPLPNMQFRAFMSGGSVQVQALATGNQNITIPTGECRCVFVMSGGK